MTQENDISVALLLGDPDDAGGAARVEEFKLPSPVTAEAVVEQLASTNVTPSDVRSRVELVVPPVATPVDVAILHATLAGYTGRFLPVRLHDGTVAPARKPDTTAPRPESIMDQVTITPASNLEDPQVHHARRAVLDVSGQSVSGTLMLLNEVAAIRRRPRYERLPDLTDGKCEPVRLEDARKVGLTYRGELRGQAKGTLVEAEEPTPRLERLQQASEAPIGEVLLRLGATHDASGEKWHCPRPQRHNNGDKNPSMKIVDGKTRCFRCDPEWVDSLRLVMDALGVTVDEAAAWIESDEQLPALH